jgi:hypothetical protein
LPAPWDKFTSQEPLEEGGAIVPQCKKPVIIYDKNARKKLVMSCEEGATIVTTITLNEDQRSESNKITPETPFVIDLKKTFTVTAYAKKDGMRRSEPVTQTFQFEDVNLDGKINTVDATEILKMLVE